MIGQARIKELGHAVAFGLRGVERCSVRWLGAPGAVKIIRCRTRALPDQVTIVLRHDRIQVVDHTHRQPVAAVPTDRVEFAVTLAVNLLRYGVLHPSVVDLLAELA